MYKVIEQNREEKKAMLMKRRKSELIDMLLTTRKF